MNKLKATICVSNKELFSHVETDINENTDTSYDFINFTDLMKAVIYSDILIIDYELLVKEQMCFDWICRIDNLIKIILVDKRINHEELQKGYSRLHILTIPLIPDYFLTTLKNSSNTLRKDLELKRELELNRESTCELTNYALLYIYKAYLGNAPFKRKVSSILNFNPRFIEVSGDPVDIVAEWNNIVSSNISCSEIINDRFLIFLPQEDRYKLCCNATNCGKVIEFTDITQSIVSIINSYRNEQKEDSYKHMKNFFEYVSEHFAEDLKIEDIEAHFNLTPGYYKEKLSAIPSFDFKMFLHEIRIYFSKKIMASYEAEGKTDKFLPSQVGFKNAGTFFIYFKKFSNGMTPVEWRKAHLPIGPNPLDEVLSQLETIYSL